MLVGKYALTEVISDLLEVQVRETREDALVRCPFHDDRHASLSINLENGWWICFACGARGGIQSLATRMNREVNDAELALKMYEGTSRSILEEPKDFSALAKTLRSNLYTQRPEDVVRFIQSRRLDARVLKHFGIGWDGANIAFPYYDEDTVFAIKYRHFNGHKFAETGSRRGIYNVNDVRFKKYVILCEGESDTLAVWSQLTSNYVSDIVEHIGVGGIPGVAASRSTWELWALDLLWAKQVFVAYDADEAGDEGTKLPMDALQGKGVRIRPTLGKDMTDHFVAGGSLGDFKGLAGALSITE